MDKTTTYKPSAIGRNLKRLRREAGWSVYEMEARTGLGNVGFIETGRTQKPRAKTIKILADALGVAFADLTKLTVREERAIRADAKRRESAAVADAKLRAAAIAKRSEENSRASINTGARMRRAREVAGLTQTDMALAIGCSKSMLSKMEAGSRAWTAPDLVRAHQACGAVSA